MAAVTPPPPSSTTNDPPFTREAFLSAQGMCAMGLFADFQAKAEALKAAAAAWAATPADANAVAGAQAAWSAAMSSWQQAELYRIGPALPVYMGSMFPGAMNLRNEIYAYPVRDTCAIDQQLSTEGYKNFTSLQPSARGLGALEYLAFNAGTAPTCTGISASALQMSFTSLSSMLPARRAAYGKAVADDVALRAGQLVAAFGPTFVSALSSGAAPYAGVMPALNALSDALFYVDRELKDFKLGRVINLTSACMPGGSVSADICGPMATESRFSSTSIRHVQTNLRSALLLFEGCGPMGAGLGFDSWLREVGAGALADQMSLALRDAIAAADALASLEGADPAAVQALHAKVKAFTDLLKTQFLSVLELQQPLPLPDEVTTPAIATGTGTTSSPATMASAGSTVTEGRAGAPTTTMTTMSGRGGGTTPPPNRPFDGD